MPPAAAAAAAAGMRSPQASRLPTIRSWWRIGQATEWVMVAE
jgi:hypothetical protein